MGEEKSKKPKGARLPKPVNTHEHETEHEVREFAYPKKEARKHEQGR